MAHVGRAAELVVDDPHLVALASELQHRPHKVLARPAEEPGAPDDPAVADLALARELRAPVDRERARLVRLDVRLALAPVEHVVGRVVDDRHADRDDVARPDDVNELGAGWVRLGPVDVGPGRRVQD